MKISLLILLLFFISSCNFKGFKNTNNDICLTNEKRTDFSDYLLPVSTGFKWVYKFELEESYKNSLSKEDLEKLPKEYVLEVGNKRDIYLNKDGKKSTINAYTIIQDGKQSNYLYFINCEKGTYLVEVNNPEELEIVANLFIANKPEKDAMYWAGVNKAKYEWTSVSGLDNPLETSNNIVLQEYIYNENIINPNDKKIKQESLFFKTGRSWYKRGVGLVKKELFYNNKQIGVMILENYDLDKLSSPIEP